MRKLTKIFVAFVVLIGLVLIGLSLFVHFYLTEDRVKALVIPKAEKVLGRTVQIGGIDVGLFSGITVKDFTVKEPDGKTNFASVREFVLRYELLPLLQKKIVVSKIRLESPYIQVVRDKTGHFNFETLAVLATPKKAAPKGAGRPTPSPALPLAVTVHQVSIDKAQIVFHDALKEIPDTKVEAGVNVALDLGRDLKSLKYQGDLHFVADAVYGGLRPHISGKGKFDQDRLDYTVDVDLEKEQACISGEVKNYAKVPDIRLDVTSDSINLGHLLDLVAGLPAASQGNRPSKGVKAAPPVAPGADLPPGLKAAGQIKIGQILYKGLVVRDFLLQYSLDKGILNIDNLSTRVADGHIGSKMQVDLNRPGLAYSGQLDANSLKIEEVLASLAPRASNMVSGTLGSHFTFSGAGTEWPRLRNNLSVEGTYGLRDGRIRNTPVTMAITRLLGLKELNNLSFKTLDGSLSIKKGKVYLKTSVNSKDVRAQAKGNVGLDGRLDLPVDLYLSPKLSKKLKKFSSIVKYLASREGETELHLKLTGTLTHPYPVLNTAGIQRQLKETIRKKAIEVLRRALTGKKKGGTKEIEQNAIKGLIKGIFGQ